MVSDEHGTSAIPGWAEFVSSLHDLPERVLARLPDRVSGDPQVQMEVVRRIFAAFAYSALDAIAGDGDYPIFRTAVGQIVNIGQPNADTAYRVARITPGGTYRIRGWRGSLQVANICQNAPFPCEPGAESVDLPGASLSHLDINALRLDDEGRFDLILSPTRPEGYDGDWWRLEPAANKLWFRGVMADWAREQDPTLSIERLDIPEGGRRRRPAAAIEESLRWLPSALTYYSTIEIEHVEKLRRGGFLNETLTYYDTSEVMGLEDQYYFECAYELGDDEALVIEATLPDAVEYWSVILTNEVFETTDWYNSHSSLNQAQAHVDGDGVVRFVIAARDPGVPNWLDTTGYPTGQFQGRWYRSRGATLPRARKLPLAEVRGALPADTPTVTPAERDRLLRERRRQLHERRLW